MIKGVIFDLDGTLIDSKSDIADSINELLSLYGVGHLSLNTVVSYLGDGANLTITRAFEQAGVNADCDLEQAYAQFKEIYKKNMKNKTVLYSGVQKVLVELNKKAVKCAVVTNKSQESSKEILKHLCIDGYLDFIYGADSLSEKKPHPLPLETVIKQWQFDKNKVIMVGDHYVDMEAAKNAGVKSIFCQYGFGWKNDHTVDYEISTIWELIDIIQKI